MNARVGWWAVVLLPALLAACAGPGPGIAPTTSPSRGTGVQGTATIDAGCPVLKDSSPCPRIPYRARIAVFRTGSDRPLTTVETGDDGRFKIDLEPGGYELRGENLSGGSIPRATPVTCVIPTGRYAEIEIEFDSGIRGPETGT